MEEKMAKCTPIQTYQTLLQWPRQKLSKENIEYLKISLNQVDINHNWVQLPELYSIQSKPHNQPLMQTFFLFFCFFVGGAAQAD